MPERTCGLCGHAYPHDKAGQAAHDKRIAEIGLQLSLTEMCDHCCRRVPRAEIEQGLHEHPAVMD